jgi:hypothetical protein
MAGYRKARSIRPLPPFFALLACTGCALAQAPIEERPASGDGVMQAQQKTSAVYRELQEAEYASKLAEQDFLNAEMAYAAAQKQTAALKQTLDAAQKNRDAARAREAALRRAYEQGIQPAKPDK